MALSANAVLNRFANLSLTPSEYLAACLERISQVNPRLNALTAIDSERAVGAAAQATTRWKAGTPRGLLDGLPIGVKDLQDTKGLLTTHGSPRMRANIPQGDLPMVARLREAGAIILAKTNVPECGAGGNSRNPVWGATGNPFDANLTCGGSSGGSAAALAANLLPLCTGSDTGGSLRLPAALCGVVGFRPSVDVIAHPTRPLGWSGISVLGPMARTVDDLVLMLRVCQGADPDDPLSSEAASDRFATLPAASLKDLRIGFSEDFGGTPVDPSIRATFRARIARITPHVRDCREVDLRLGDMDRCFDILRAESFVSAFADPIKSDAAAFGPDIAANVELGLSMSLADRAWAHAEQTRILRRFNAVMRDYDVILLPTAPISPFPWTQGNITEVDGAHMGIYYRWLALTYRGSLTGGPSITLPCGRDPQGMPFGLQMLGPVRSDEALLATAKAVEMFFAADPETARPCPDMAGLAASDIDLRSIVTHPPILNGSDRSRLDPLGTAV
ncbi:amidase [Sulfitobacter sp. EhC04]|uniref:amidase n=1 Tax=Sulfitobacter sp. EhC04 TaxID=1849168 RepID=UPI000AEFA6E4|nr:amidase [Sulfitobacter sp. EhC04]